MWPAFLSPPERRGYLEPVSPRRRAASIALTVAVHLLIVWLLLRLAPALTPRKLERTPSTFSMLPSEEEAAERPAAKAQVKAAAAKPSAAAKAPLPPAATVRLPVPPIPAIEKPPTILWDKSLFAAADVGKIKGTADAADDGADTANSKAAYGPGEGPGGQRLYYAQWYREPRQSELSTYLPAAAPVGSWGIIACQTIANYHVENCRSVGESLGSGMSRGMRLAAWQFLVRPSRLGGKAMIGEWVRIRIEITPQGVK